MAIFSDAVNKETSGIINLRERKSLQSISVNVDEQSRNVIEFENWLYKIPVTLTYTTGESETLETSDGNSIWTSGWDGNYSVLEIRSSEGGCDTGPSSE